MHNIPPQTINRYVLQGTMGTHKACLLHMRMVPASWVSLGMRM